MGSLADYAQRNPRPRGRPCSVCILPAKVRQQVDEALRAGHLGRPLIADWLTTEGHKISRAMLDNHAGGKHHVEPR